MDDHIDKRGSWAKFAEFASRVKGTGGAALEASMPTTCFVAHHRKPGD